MATNLDQSVVQFTLGVAFFCIRANYRPDLADNLMDQLINDSRIETMMIQMDDSLLNRLELFICDEIGISQFNTVCDLNLGPNLKIERSLRLIHLMLKNHQPQSHNPIIGLHRIVYLMSIIHYDHFYQTNAQLSHSFVPLFHYLKSRIEDTHKITFDNYYIINNRLFQYRNIFKNEILKANKNLDDIKLVVKMAEIFESSEELYLLLRKIDSHFDFEESKILKNFFWSKFDDLTFEEKISLIEKVYTNKSDFKQTESAIDCLHETSHLNEATLIINQLTNDNCEQPKLLNSLSRLMCRSLESTIEKLINNLLSSKNQINTLHKVS